MQNQQSIPQTSTGTQGGRKKKKGNVNNAVKKKRKKANASLNERKKQQQVKTPGHNTKKYAKVDVDSSQSTPQLEKKASSKQVKFRKNFTTHVFDPSSPANQSPPNKSANPTNGEHRNKKKGEVKKVAKKKRKKANISLNGDNKQPQVNTTHSQKKKPAARPTQKGAVAARQKKNAQVPVTVMSAGSFRVIELYYNFQRTTGPYATFVFCALVYAGVCAVPWRAC